MPSSPRPARPRRHSPPTIPRSSSSTCAAFGGAGRIALPYAPIGAEAMRGADRLGAGLGVTEERLMEQAGTAVAAAVRALAVDIGRWGKGPIVILCGPGNNGGDGYVAARRLALTGAEVVVAVIASEARPTGAASSQNWDRIARDAGIVKVHAPVARDVAVFGTRHREGGGHRRRPARNGRPRPPSRADPDRGRGHRSRAGGRHPGRGRRHADCGRPVERRAVRSGGPSRPHRHVPPAQDRSR